MPVQPPRTTMLNDTGFMNTAGRGCLIMILGAIAIIGVVKLVQCDGRPKEINGIPIAD